jgi:hypothetical protein
MAINSKSIANSSRKDNMINHYLKTKYRKYDNELGLFRIPLFGTVQTFDLD